MTKLTYRQKIDLLNEYYESSNNPYAKILADIMLTSVKELNFFCIGVIDDFFKDYAQFSYKIKNQKIVAHIVSFKPSLEMKDKLIRLKKFLDLQLQEKAEHTLKLPDDDTK